jgi:type II secretory pathway predicted ATPase ExeA
MSVSIHPVLKQRGFTLKAPPLLEFVGEFSKLMSFGETGMVMYSAQRYGKTTAAKYVRERVAENNTCVVLHSHIGRERNPPSGADHVWMDMYRGDAPTVSQHIRTPMLSLIHKVQALADKQQTPRVLISIDEAQNLTDDVYFGLKKLVDDFIDVGLSPFVLLVAQPEILARASKLKKRLLHDLVDRFLTRWHRFRGLRLDEFAGVMRHYDKLCWPEDSDTPYSEYFVPDLWRAGWRLEQLAPRFAAEFERLARSIGRDPSDIGMKYVTSSVRGLFNMLQANPALANHIETLVHDCVHSCGFIESAKQVGDAEGDARLDQAGVAKPARLSKR